MKIGIDVRPLQDSSKFRGIGYYLSHLLIYLSKIDKKNEYFFFGFSAELPQLKKLEEGFKSHFEAQGKVPLHELRYKLRSVFFPSPNLRSKKLDLFLATDVSYGMPKGKHKTLGVIYDVTPLFSPSPKPLKERLIWGVGRWLYKTSFERFRKADKLISISESTKKDFLNFFDYQDEDIVVTPLAQDEIFHPAPHGNHAVLKKYGIEPPYILYVGGCDFRKNLAGLISAFEKVALELGDLHLVLAGGDFVSGRDPDSLMVRKLIERSPFKEKIICPGYIPLEDMPLFYSGAEVFVYPSLYEGFGLPILEAMACGCPVVAYNNSSIPEVAGNAALLIDFDEELSVAIERVIKDKRLREALIKQGLERVEKFSWAKTAQETLKVFEEVGRK